MYSELGFIELKAYTVSEALYRKIYAQIIYFYKFYRTYDQMNVASALESERSKNFTFLVSWHIHLWTHYTFKREKTIILLSLLFMS